MSTKQAILVTAIFALLIIAMMISVAFPVALASTAQATPTSTIVH